MENAFELLTQALDVVLDPPEHMRRNLVHNFLKDLSFGSVKLGEIDQVLMRLSVCEAYSRGQVLRTTPELVKSLSPMERERLKEKLTVGVKRIEQDFPEFKSEFSFQFN